MTLDDYTENLLWENFDLKPGDKIPWQVLAAAFCLSRTKNFIIERVQKIISRMIHCEFPSETLKMMLDLEPDEIEPFIKEHEERIKKNQD